MPKTDEQIEALEARLKHLKVQHQLKEARGRTAGARRVSVYAALVLSAMGLGAVDAANPPSPCPGAAAWNEAHREQLPEAIAARDPSPVLRQWI